MGLLILCNLHVFENDNDYIVDQIINIIWSKISLVYSLKLWIPTSWTTKCPWWRVKTHCQTLSISFNNKSATNFRDHSSFLLMLKLSYSLLLTMHHFPNTCKSYLSCLQHFPYLFVCFHKSDSLTKKSFNCVMCFCKC